MNWFELEELDGRAIPFGMDENGVIKDVDEVTRGLSCRCFCPDCGGPLIARQGDVKIHHFAHHDRSECRFALEASIYAMAMETLTENPSVLRLPKAGYYANWANRFRVSHDDPRLRNFIRTRWAISSQDLVLSPPFSAGSSSMQESSWSRPDLKFPSLDLDIHLISHKKPHHQSNAMEFPKDRISLGINLTHYVGLWTETCDPERDQVMEELRSARSAMADWLRKSEYGRGFLFHPSLERSKREFQKTIREVEADELYRRRRLREERAQSLEVEEKKWAVPVVQNDSQRLKLYHPVELPGALFPLKFAQSLGFRQSNLTRRWVWVGEASAIVPHEVRIFFPRPIGEWKVFDEKLEQEFTHKESSLDKHTAAPPPQETTQPSKLISSDVGRCGVCDGIIRRTLYKRGFYADKIVDECSKNPKHPAKAYPADHFK